MNMKKWLSDIIASENKKALPVLSFPGIGLMGITVKDLIQSSELQAECMARVAKTCDTAASVSFMDLSVEAEAFGGAVSISDNEVPTIIGSLVETEEQAEALAVPEVGAGRTGIYVEAIRLAKKSITDRPVLAGVIGPFSLAGRLMGVSEAMINCYEEPEMVEIILEKAAAFLIEYIKAFKSAGADGVVMAEPLAGMLSPRLAERFSEDYVKQIAKAVKSDDFIMVYHNCGNNTVQMIDSILRTECDAYHFGDAIDMRNMLPLIPKDIVVMGNISPSAEFLNGTPQSIRKATLDLMHDCCKEYPNFVVSSGCDLPPLVPWENISAFFGAVDEYYENN